MTGRYEPLASAADLPPLVRELSARTMIIDVEPFIAPWDSGQDALDQGIASFLAGVAAIETVAVVFFATNSARVPSALPATAGIKVEYLVSARKPLRTAPYRGLPVPGLVIGDQVATDGILAKRIGYTFLHYRPEPSSMPPGPRILFGCGTIIRPVLFHPR